MSIWNDAADDRVPTSVIASRKGHQHCGWEGVTFLHLDTRQFLRDPGGVIAARHRRQALWLAHDGSAAYVVEGAEVERWPATRELLLCR